MINDFLKRICEIYGTTGLQDLHTINDLTSAEVREISSPRAVDIETLSSGLHLLQAPCGSGKTQSVGAPFVKRSKEEGLTVIISHRRSLISELSRRLSATDYRENNVAEKVRKSGALAVCLPSLGKNGLWKVIRQARHVYIDEASQVVDQLFERDLLTTAESSPETIYARFCQLLKSAESVLCADATFELLAAKLLQKWAGKECTHWSVPEAFAGKATVVDADSTELAEARLYYELYKSLVDGQRCWVSCESKAVAERLASALRKEGDQRLDGCRILVVTGDTKHKKRVQDFLENPDQVSLSYDVVLHTSTVSSGISIQHDMLGAASKHFSRTLAIGRGCVLEAAELYQMSRRVRYVDSLFFAVGPYSNESRARTERELHLERQLADSSYESNGDYELLRQRWLRDKDERRYDFKDQLLVTLRREGFSYEIEDSGCYNDFADHIEASVPSLKDFRKKLKVTEKISVREAIELASRSVTETESYNLLAFEIRQLYGVEELTKTVVDHHYEHGSGAVERRLNASGEALDTKSAKYREKFYKRILKDFDISDELVLWPEDREAMFERLCVYPAVACQLGIISRSTLKQIRRYLAEGKGERKSLKKVYTAATKDLFERLGIELDSKQRQRNGSREYCYCSDAQSVEFMNGVIERRLQGDWLQINRSYNFFDEEDSEEDVIAGSQQYPEVKGFAEFVEKRSEDEVHAVVHNRNDDNRLTYKGAFDEELSYYSEMLKDTPTLLPIILSSIEQNIECLFEQPFQTVAASSMPIEFSMSGIYTIYNCNTHDFYIGRSRNLQRRMTKHFDMLELGIHSSFKFQNAFDNSSLDDWECLLLEPLKDNVPFQIVREQWWLDRYYSEYHCLNVSTSAE